MISDLESRDKLGIVSGRELFKAPGYIGSHHIPEALSDTTTYQHQADDKLSVANLNQKTQLPSPRSSDSSRAVSEMESEIVVRTEDDDMDVDEAPSPTPDVAMTVPSNNNASSQPEAAAATASPRPSTKSVVSHLRGVDSMESTLSNITDQSDLSSLASLSSKATTPVDHDASKPFAAASAPEPSHRHVPRRTFSVLPRSSVPAGMPDEIYAERCIHAAESSRLDPFSLHQDEYLLLRQHITHSQVTAYLNIRNAILRLWVNNTQIPVTRDEAVGCATARYFDLASVCYDWLVRRGYINFGCVDFPSSPSTSDHSKLESYETKRKTIVVIGGGMSGLGCARQLEGLGKQYADRFREQGQLPPKVVVLEGRGRVGGRLYSREFRKKPSASIPGYEGQRYTAEMGGMIITGFDRGNPVNVLLRGQLGLGYRALRPDTTIYDSNGRPVDQERDLLVEKLYNDCLDRVSEYKHKSQPAKLIKGRRDLIQHGRDSNSEGSKTISQLEEAAASQPHALPVSQQNVPERVNRIPVSSDRVTGRVHTEPGVAATIKAPEKAKLMGWTLKNSIAHDSTIDLTEAVARPGATLGSVMDEAIVQYRDIVDLTAQDHRLLNWHIANLEYSNATNLHKLSLPSWDIDAGNEWEGKHTMVVGGYQAVPRGLALCPTRLDVRPNMPVNYIKYDPDNEAGKTMVSCEDGSLIEADYIVSTIPLGVLKQPGSVTFEPPLPSWKEGAMERMGFGVLNKVILAFEEPFWEAETNIFGVLRDAPNRHSLNQGEYGERRGRFFQWFNVTETTGLPCLIALMAGDAGFNVEHEDNDTLVDEAMSTLRGVFGGKVPSPVEAIITRWESDRFARGSYSSAGPDMLPDDYKDMARPIGNLFFAGEHTIGSHPATVHGAYMSGLRAASELFDELLGPIDVPTPLILPKNSMSSSALTPLKRKDAPEDPEQARLEQYELSLWDHVASKIGHRPDAPGKIVANAYLLFNKASYDVAKRRVEDERAAGNSKRKLGPNDVRIMTSRMWKALSPEERKPYEDQAQLLRDNHAIAVMEFNEKSAKWDKDYVELRGAYEKEHPFVPLAAAAAAAASSSAAADGSGTSSAAPDGAGEGSAAKQRRKAKMVDYAESESE